MSDSANPAVLTILPVLSGKVPHRKTARLLSMSALDDHYPRSEWGGCSER
jgi:hypothetical protein